MAAAPFESARFACYLTKLDNNGLLWPIAVAMFHGCVGTERTDTDSRKGYQCGWNDPADIRKHDGTDDTHGSKHKQCKQAEELIFIVHGVTCRMRGGS